MPCFHTFCLKCLLQYSKHENNDQPGDQLACPLCRTNFVIPPGGLADLPNNFFVNKLLLVDQLSGASETLSAQQCDICKEDEIDASASGYCIDCDQHLCEKCSKFHVKQKFLKSHKIVNLNENSSSESLLKMTASYCMKHPSEQIKFYCYDCKMITCVVCHVTEHNKHECCDVNKSAEEFRKQLDDDIDKVTSCAQQSRDKL